MLKEPIPTDETLDSLYRRIRGYCALKEVRIIYASTPGSSVPGELITKMHRSEKEPVYTLTILKNRTAPASDSILEEK